MQDREKPRILAGKYRLVKELAGGGTGRVYLAQDLRLPKYWAVKEIPGRTEECYGRVRREAVLLGNGRHPGLPVVVDLLPGEDVWYLVMEYVEGETLEEMVSRQGPLSEMVCLDVMRQLAEILAFLHNRHPAVYYLDMKPSNVLWTAEQKVMLVDFGAAMEADGAAGARGSLFGTFGYAPPEQCGGMSGSSRTERSGIRQECDARSDIYALGATAYFLLTGWNPARPPFGLRPVSLWKSCAGRAYIQVILRCTQAEPEKRFQSMEELLCALQACRTKYCGIQKWLADIGIQKKPFVLRQEKTVFLTEKRQRGLVRNRQQTRLAEWDQKREHQGGEAWNGDRQKQYR